MKPITALVVNTSREQFQLEAGTSPRVQGATTALGEVCQAPYFSTRNTCLIWIVCSRSSTAASSISCADLGLKSNVLIVKPAMSRWHHHPRVAFECRPAFGSSGPGKSQVAFAFAVSFEAGELEGLNLQEKSLKGSTCEGAGVKGSKFESSEVRGRWFFSSHAHLVCPRASLSSSSL